MLFFIASILLLGQCVTALPDPSIKTSCDDITYGFCRLDEGNFFVPSRLSLYPSLNQSVCQIECTVDNDCAFYLYESGTCKFIRTPDQYFKTCRDVASTPHVDFERCFSNVRAASCNSEELGSRKYSTCSYDGKILERMPAADATICEKACNLRYMSKDENDRCRYFVFNGETGECQLLGETITVCHKFMGPPLVRDACSTGDLAPIFDAVNQLTPDTPTDGNGAGSLTNSFLATLVITAIHKFTLA